MRTCARPSRSSPLTQQEYFDLRAEYPLRDPLPWWVDNGPLTPGGFGMEYPHLFDPTPEDPVGTDFYLTKAMKYPYAPDTYLAFPVGYFHYYGDGPGGAHGAGPGRARPWLRSARIPDCRQPQRAPLEAAPRAGLRWA